MFKLSVFICFRGIKYPGCVSCLSFHQQTTRQVVAYQTLLLPRQRTFCWHARQTLPTALTPQQVEVLLHSHQANFNETFDETAPILQSLYLRPWHIEGNNLHINNSLCYIFSGLLCVFAIVSYVTVIVKRDSQHRRLRVSRPDLGLADRSDLPVCGLAAAHKHTLWSRCYFHPSVHHTLTCHMDSDVPLALVQTQLTTNADLITWPVVQPEHRRKCPVTG